VNPFVFGSYTAFIGTVIAAVFTFFSRNQDRSATAQQATKTEEEKRREHFMDKIYDGWDSLTHTVDVLRDENIKLGSKVVKLEGAETRLTGEIGALKEQNKTLKETAETARLESATAKAAAEEERRLFERQRKAWGDWAKKVLAFIKDAGYQIPVDLENPPFD
jgi:predicted  nucleic acid-binding Zn-ribbon protein